MIDVTELAPPCCDLHNQHCEPPADLCCARCTEASHPDHRRGETCVLAAPDRSAQLWGERGSMSDVDDLVTWLRAQLDEDDRLARTTEATLCREWVADFREVFTADDEAREVVSAVWSEGVTEHIARHDPARVLAEVDAKRVRLDLIAELATRDPDTALRFAKAEALPYADRPGYRDEWKP